jgi:hypothetical protein
MKKALFDICVKQLTLFSSTHRNRTQGYIRELEKEVLRLRDRESHLVHENEMLNSRIVALSQPSFANERPLINENVSLPEPQFLLPSNASPIDYTGGFGTSLESFHGDLSASHSATGSGVGTSPSITVDLTELSIIEPEKWCSETAALEVPRRYELPFVSPAQLVAEQNNPATAHWGSSRRQQYVSAPPLSQQAGIDFVLEYGLASPNKAHVSPLITNSLIRLERPCLGHVKFNYLQDASSQDYSHDLEFNAGPNHVFSAMSILIHSEFAQAPMIQPFEVPTANIELLFHTGLSLDLGPDITPIQIWANIQRISRTFPIDAAVLAAVLNECSKYIRCNR